MKNLKLSFVLLLTLSFVNAQNPEIEWIKQDGGNGDDFGTSITTDENYVYSTGVFSDTCFIGDTVLISNGSYDIYISKYDKKGNFIWVKQFGGTGYDRGNSIVYNNGHVYTTGFFADTAFFDGTTLISNGGCDIFITDQSTDGTLNWVKQIGGTERDQGYALTTDSENNIYLSGIFKDTVNFGDTIFISYGEYDIFTAKLDNAGNIIWINQAGGTGTDIGISMVSDNSDNIYLTGSFEDTAAFNGTSLISLGYQDIFIAKYNSSGNLVWAHQAGGDWGAQGASVTTDASANLYVSGIFGGTAFFGNDTVVSNGWFDIFLAKYDNAGTLQWINTYGSIEKDYSYSVVTDDDFVYVSCYFRDEASIDDTVLLAYTSHIFQLSNTGNLLGMIQTGNYIRNKCTIDNNSALYVTGAFNHTQIFGDTVLTSTGFFDDVFITRINYGHTGIEESALFDQHLKIYPNPATNYINIESNENAVVSILNINGQLIKQYLFEKGLSEGRIDISGFMPGLYIVTLQTKNTVFSAKMIKH